MCKSFVKGLFLVFTAVISCDGQSEFMLPFGPNTLRQIIRSKTPLPSGRKGTLSDVRLHYFGGNSTEDFKTYRLNTIQDVLSETSFDPQRPTAFYAHGFVELAEDESVRSVVAGYLRAGGSNLLVVDWANLGFGSYLQAARNVQRVGRDLGRRIIKLTSLGLPSERIHLVGHSLGAHLVAYAARQMKTKDIMVPRITGLDPAMPGFYPPLSFLGDHVTADDASFVDIIHTDGGRYGASSSTGHADFWPNGGTARQPGCQINTVLLTYEDFCGHWRSWRFWAESLTGGGFESRPCQDYEAFTRGECAAAPVAHMGARADKELRGNFYLRTAGSPPFSLGPRGAD